MADLKFWSPVPPPRTGELLVRQHAASVNFHYLHVRSGSNRTLKLPGIPGLEAVGTIEAVGEGVTDFAVGDRIAQIARQQGGYAHHRIISAALAVPVPAAGGGVGQLLARMARRKGGFVSGTAGSSEKAAIALAAGCHEVILYRDEDVASRVMALTNGEGVAAAYDTVGADTFGGSLASLPIMGRLVHYGQASGSTPAFDLSLLCAKSAKVSRPFLQPHISRREALLGASRTLFAAMAARELPLALGGRFALADAAKAPGALEARAAGPFALDC